MFIQGATGLESFKHFCLPHLAAALGIAISDIEVEVVRSTDRAHFVLMVEYPYTPEVYTAAAW